MYLYSVCPLRLCESPKGSKTLEALSLDIAVSSESLLSVCTKSTGTPLSTLMYRNQDRNGRVVCREQSSQCGTLTSLAALSVGKVTHTLYSQQNPLLGRVGRCWDFLTEWLAGGRDIRGASFVRAILLLCFSAVALLLSLTSLSLGKAISSRIDEVVKSSTGRASIIITHNSLSFQRHDEKSYFICPERLCI